MTAALLGGPQGNTPGHRLDTLEVENRALRMQVASHAEAIVALQKQFVALLTELGIAQETIPGERPLETEAQGRTAKSAKATKAN